MYMYFRISNSEYEFQNFKFQNLIIFQMNSDALSQIISPSISLGFDCGKAKCFLGVVKSHLLETPRLKEQERDLLTPIQSKREKVRGRLNVHRIEQNRIPKSAFSIKKKLSDQRRRASCSQETKGQLGWDLPAPKRLCSV